METKSSNSIEVWKDIEGFEGFYQVSSESRIKSLARKTPIPSRGFLRNHKEKILKIKPSKNHYPIVSLHGLESPSIRQVHRIVAEHFLENPDNLPYINHKNGNKNDYRLVNLEWCTHLQNMRHAFSTGLIPSGQNHFKSKLTDRNVLVIRRILRINPKYNQSVIARKFNVGRSTINAIAKNKKWKYLTP